MLKKLIVLLVLGGGVVFGQCTTNYSLGFTQVTAPVDSRVNKCLSWALTFTTTGVKSLLFNVESAKDNGGQPGSFSAFPGINPQANLSGLLLFTINSSNGGFAPWIRINLSYFVPIPGYPNPSLNINLVGTPSGSGGGGATVSVGTTATLSPGSQATVTNAGTSTNAILNFGIPTGANGTPGGAGSNGSNGTNGSNGSAATITIGSVTTGSPGSSATVTNSGTSSAAVFNFAIPQGATGSGGGSGSGTVNSGTQYQIGYYATDGTDISGNPNIVTDAFGDLSASGVVIGASLKGSNLTSGNCLQATTGGGIIDTGSACGSGGGGGDGITQLTGIVSTASGSGAQATDINLGGSGALQKTGGSLDINTAVLPTLAGVQPFTATQKFQAGINLNNSNTQPTCDSSHRGITWFINGGSSKDGFQVCAYDGNSYAWRAIY